MFFDLVNSRYSVRKYSDRPVEDEKLAKILEAGRLAPTAANKQPQVIYVLKSKEAMETARVTTVRMMYNASLALLVCYDDRLSWKGDNYGSPGYDGGEVDAAIVTTTMMMQAEELGVGSLWVRGFSYDKVVEAFELPEHIRPVCFLVLGYPAEDSAPSPSHTNRKPAAETIFTL